MRVLITGTAGFIGFHLARRLLADGHEVAGIDGLTPYYDVTLKHRRNAILAEFPLFTANEVMLEDKERVDAIVAAFKPEIMVHLAAQAGVRYSLEHPDTYISSNLVGTFTVLEAARALKPRHLLMASTSSVYGGNERMPFKETDRTDFPVSLYAATKKAAEAMSHSYAHLRKIPTTCFRFFTVYGPWGRPDMALYKFVDAIEKGEAIEVYGNGQMQRDFTFVDDLVEGVVRLIDRAPEEGNPVVADGVIDSLSPVAPWRGVNIAGGQPVELMALIEAIETSLGKTATKTMLPMQKGDVVATFADPGLLEALTGFVPRTSVATAVEAFVAWYREYRDGA